MKQKIIKLEFKKRMEEAINKYSQDNWGGEDEAGLSEETIKNARLFVDLFELPINKNETEK